MSHLVPLNDLDAAPAPTFHTVVVGDVDETLFGEIIRRLEQHKVVRALNSFQRSEFFAGLRQVIPFYIGTRKAVREPARHRRGRRASVEIPALILDCAQLLGRVRNRAPRIWISPGTGNECIALQVAREIIGAVDRKRIPHQGSLQRQAANAQVMLKKWVENLRMHLIRSGAADQQVWHSIGVYLDPRNSKWIADYYRLYLAKHLSAFPRYWPWWGLNGPPSTA